LLRLSVCVIGSVVAAGLLLLLLLLRLLLTEEDTLLGGHRDVALHVATQMQMLTSRHL